MARLRISRFFSSIQPIAALFKFTPLRRREAEKVYRKCNPSDQLDSALARSIQQHQSHRIVIVGDTVRNCSSHHPDSDERALSSDNQAAEARKLFGNLTSMSGIHYGFERRDATETHREENEAQRGLSRRGNEGNINQEFLYANRRGEHAAHGRMNHTSASDAARRFGRAASRGCCRTRCAHTTSGREIAHPTTTILTKKTNLSKKYATLRPRAYLNAKKSLTW